MQEDTVHLLGDCTVGIEMALGSLEELLNRVRDPRLREKLRGSVEDHRNLQQQAGTQLQDHGARPRTAGPVARTMAWMKISGTMALRGDDCTAARLICEGCDRGVRSLSRSRNCYAGADPAAVTLAQNLIRVEERLSAGIRPWL